MEPIHAEQFAFLARQGLDPASLRISGRPPRTVAYLAQTGPEWLPLFTAYLAALDEQHPGRDFSQHWKLARMFENRNPVHLQGIGSFDDLKKAIGELVSAKHIKNKLEQQGKTQEAASYVRSVAVLDNEVLPVFRKMTEALRTYLRQEESNHLKIMKTGQGPDALARRQRERLAALAVASTSLHGILDVMSGLSDHPDFARLEAKEFFARFRAKLEEAREAAAELDAALLSYRDAWRASRAYAKGGGGDWEAAEDATARWSSLSVEHLNSAGRAFKEAAEACGIWAREKANLIHRAEEIGFFDHQSAGVVLQLADTFSDLALTAGASQKYLGPVALGFAGLKALKSGLRTVWQVSKDWDVTTEYIVANVPVGVRVSFRGSEENRTARRAAEAAIETLGQASEAFRAEGITGDLGKGLGTVAAHVPDRALDGVLDRIAHGLDALPQSSHLDRLPGVSEALAAPKVAREVSRLVYEKVDVITDPEAVREARQAVERCLGPLVLDDLDALCSSVEVLVHGDNTLKIAFPDLVTGERRVGWLDSFMNFQDEKDRFGPMSLWVCSTARQADLDGTLNWKFPADAQVHWDRLMFIDAQNRGDRIVFVYHGEVTYGRAGGCDAPGTEVTIEFDAGDYEFISVEVKDLLAEERGEVLRLAAMELETLAMALPSIPDGCVLTELADRSFFLDESHPLLSPHPPAEVQNLSWNGFLTVVAEWNDWVRQGYVRAGA
ncbi:hypothetical protein ACFXPI_11300 [Streptomyces sp. NPDC059104]|uniref:hypothetical protein n=1 Tax=Streptomyces sp. NPDC059104 TaxID=3346729 RepID=UPI0036C3F790